MRTEGLLSPRCAAAAVGGVVAFGAGAPSARGADFTLNLSGPPSARVGQPMIIQATGTTPPPADYWFPVWLDAVAIPASLVPSCPASYLDGSQVAAQTARGGGEIVTPYSLRVNPDAAGNFSNPIGYTPREAGTMLFCGYTEDGLSNTHVSTTLTLNVRSFDKPANVTPPRVTRAGGRIVCSPGRWSNDPSGYAYGWIVGGKRKHGAGGPKLRVTARLRGRGVRCAVTASNAAGATTVVSRSLRVRWALPRAQDRLNRGTGFSRF